MIEYENLSKANEPFFEEFEESFRDTLRGGWYILGNNVKVFEKEFSDYIGSKYCIGVASGLDALMLALKAMDFEPGSEIIVPSNTYIATIISIIQCGHKPVLVEPDLRSYNIDPEKIEERITGRTRAIMVVHLYGRSCDMEPIMRIAGKHRLEVIEDCAQSHGAKYKGKTTGTFGTGAFSFYPTKNLGALGDAGGVVTDSESLDKAVRRLRNYGSDVKYYNEVVGFNSRLDEVQAGFLSIKLRRLDDINQHKRELAELYFSGLKDDFIKPLKDEDHYDVYHIFNVRHPERDRLREFMLNEGIKTDIHYPETPHKQKAMLELFKGEEYPISEEIHKTTLSLPISYFHTKDDISKVIEVMNRF